MAQIMQRERLSPLDFPARDQASPHEIDFQGFVNQVPDHLGLGGWS